MSKKKIIILPSIIIILFTAHFLILPFVLKPYADDFERMETEREQQSDDPLISINSSEFYKVELQYNDVIHVGYTAKSNSSIILLIVNEKGYKEYKENEIVSDISDNNLYEESDIKPNDKESGSVHIDDNLAYIILKNEGFDIAEAEIDIIGSPGIFISPGYWVLYLYIEICIILTIIYLIVTIWRDLKNRRKEI